MERHRVLRLSYLLTHLDLLSSDSFSSDFSSDSFFSLTALTSAFPSVHIVGSQTSKRPSILFIQIVCVRCMEIYSWVTLGG